MKKITLLFTMLVVALMGVMAQTVLTPGDIAIIGVGCDAPDSYSFVALVDLEAGTVINFTDNGVKSDGTIRSGEGTEVWTAQAAVSAGTVVALTGLTGLSSSGDQVVAYQGTEQSPTYIYIAMANSSVFQVGSDDSNQSDLPTGLINGTTAVAAGAGAGDEEEYDNVWYSGDVTSGTKAELLAAISNNANWTGDNSSYSPKSGSFTVNADGADPAPTITNISKSLEFTYVEGNGPSPVDSFSIKADNIVVPVLVDLGALPTNFDIMSTPAGAAIGSPISFEVSGSVDTTFYVRLKAGLSAGAFSETIAIDTSFAVVDKSISIVSGQAENDYEVELEGEVLPESYALPFAEDFEDGLPIDWTIDAEVGSDLWENKTYSENSYMQASAFNSGDAVNTTWLISPKIKLDDTAKDEFTFDVNTGYSTDGDTLTIWYTTNYTGDASTTTWTEFPDDFTITKTPNGYGSFANADKTDLSAINGTIQIGFKYYAYTDNTGTYQIDNVSVKESTVTLLSETISEVKVFATNGAINIRGIEQEEVTVYDIAGRMVTKQVVADQGSIAVKGGIYLVRVAGTVTKVAVK